MSERIQEIRERQEAAQGFLLKCDRTNLGCQVPQAVKLIDDDIPYLIGLVETLQRDTEPKTCQGCARDNAFEKLEENPLECVMCKRFFKTDNYEAISLIESPSHDWTPCDERMPTQDGFYMVTIRIDNALQHGEYESRVELDQGHWCQISSDMKVTAWRKESPYRADHIRDTTKKMQEGTNG